MTSTELYATIDELKAQVNKEYDDDDTVLTAIITAASRAIDNYCNRINDGFVAASSASARVFPGSGKAYQFIDECIEIETVGVKDSATDETYTTWTTDDWIGATGEPKMPNFNRVPYNFIMIRLDTGSYTYFPKSPFPIVQVTAKWGYAEVVPSSIKQATITTAARWYKRGQSSWADTLASGDFGQLQFRKVLDPDVQMMLRAGRYVRPAI
jgi:hypothetical protein